MNDISYTVVGVLEPKGGSLGGNQDNFAVVPITTGLNRFGRWTRSLNILVQSRDRRYSWQAGFGHLNACPGRLVLEAVDVLDKSP